MLNQPVSVIAEKYKEKVRVNNEEATRKATELFDKMVILKDEIYRNLPNRYNDPNSYLDINNQGHGKKFLR